MFDGSFGSDQNLDWFSINSCCFPVDLKFVNLKVREGLKNFSVILMESYRIVTPMELNFSGSMSLLARDMGVKWKLYISLSIQWVCESISSATPSYYLNRINEAAKSISFLR